MQTRSQLLLFIYELSAKVQGLGCRVRGQVLHDSALFAADGVWIYTPHASVNSA